MARTARDWIAQNYAGKGGNQHIVRKHGQTESKALAWLKREYGSKSPQYSQFVTANQVLGIACKAVGRKSKKAK